MDGVGGHGAFAEALEDELELAGVGGDVADGEDAGGGGLAGGGGDLDVHVPEVEAPGGDGAEVHGEAEEGEEAVGLEVAGVAVEVGDFDGLEGACLAVDGTELVGDDEFELAGGVGGVELSRGLGGGAELGAAVHDVDLGRNVFQAEGPIDGAVAAAGDDDVAVAEVLAAFDEVLDGAGVFEGLEAFEGGAVRAEGAGAGGEEDGLGVDRVTLVGAEGEGAGLALESFDPAAEEARDVEGGDLRLEVGDEVAGLDRGVGGDVVDGFLGVEGGALAADFGEGVDEKGAQLEHAALEGGEEADGACADDGDVGFECLAHGAYLAVPGGCARRLHYRAGLCW